MMAGGWISENNILYCWPIQTVYTFHVPLFFVCSGFLYQATAPNEWNVKKHIGNIKKKALALGVPYVTFSTITLLLKNVFATDVNNAAPPFLKTLLIEPIAPYWYLYTLFLLFCLIPPVIGKEKRKPLVSMVVIACFMKIIYVGWLADKAIPDLVAKVMASAVWFCIGMLITATPFKKSKLADGMAAGMVILACILSYFVYSTPTDNAKAQFIFASIFVLVITYFFQSKEQYKTDGLVNHSAKYFMPVYVLHTIVAAGVRTVLLKIGISSGILHFMIGFSVSVFVPILYAYWKKYNYIKNYFLMHIFFRMVTDANPELWEQVPAMNHIDSHLLIAAVVLVGIVLLSPIKEKFISASSRTEIGIDPLAAFTSGRSTFWTYDILTMIKNNPIRILFGNGVNYLFKINYAHFGNPLWAHNDFIQIFSDYGLFGLLVYLGMFITLFKKTFDGIRISKMAMMMLVAIWAFNAFFNMFYTTIVCRMQPCALD